MNKYVGALLVAALGLTAGCGLFDKKEEEKPKSEGDANANGGGGGGGGGMDPLSFVNAPGNVNVTADAKVGYMAEQTVESGGQKSVTTYAIVGESGDSWLIESESPAITAMAGSFPDLKGMIFGLTVRKSDGVVTKAVAGKPGEVGKDVKIGPANPTQQTTAPKGIPDKCTIGLGTFEALKFENSGVVQWVGTSGNVKDTLLKVQGTDGYELSEMPRDEDVDVGGTKVKARYTAYSNGMKTWATEDRVICCFFSYGAGDAKRTAAVKQEATNTKLAVTAMKTDAKPQLKW